MAGCTVFYYTKDVNKLYKGVLQPLSVPKRKVQVQVIGDSKFEFWIMDFTMDLSIV